MIVKILSRGKSFKGLAAYLTHDANAKTQERVAWTHTLNLAHDHVPSAVDEMLWTARHAELLKQEAGIRAGGRTTANAVKHISLNWAPDERPARAQMIEASEAFLQHMGWADHQALLVAHQDKHPHVHLALNVVSPETGLRLDDNFERRRAQAWALDYEKSQGRIQCEQRLLEPAEREDAPTRPVWQAFRPRQQEFRQAENIHENDATRPADEEIDPATLRASEWKILKELQQEQRREYFAQGKASFSELRNAVYRDVRQEFRERWADFYEARDADGADPAALTEMKAALVAERTRVLEARRDEACAALRETRDKDYRELLDEQRDIRLGLRWRQEAGLENDLFLDRVRDRHQERGQPAAFAEAAQALTIPPDDPTPTPAAYTYTSREPTNGMRSGADVGAGIGFGLLSIFGSLADGLSGAAPPQTQARAPEPAPRPDYVRADNEAAQQRQRDTQAQADEEWRRRQRASARD